MPRLLALCVAVVLAVSTAPATSQAAAKPPGQRIVGLGFEDVVDGAVALPAIARRLDQVRATGVSLSIGRVDWAAFPSALGPQAQSSAVRETGRDYVAEAISTLGRRPSGKPRAIVLVLDTLVEGWIARTPSIAGRDLNGVPSPDFPSLAQLESGAVGRRIVALAGEAAARYRPTAVSLTELFNASHTFGAEDLRSFRAHTGLADWPRTTGGRIDEWHPRIARWRADVIAGLVARVRDATHAHGAKLWMEVRVNWSDPGRDRLESGHDYALLARAADKLVLWGYFATRGRPASSLTTVARATSKRAPGKVIMSIGLWGDGDSTITPSQLARASRATVRGGVRTVWVTPNSRMSPAHWKALKKAWRRT